MIARAQRPIQGREEVGEVRFTRAGSGARIAYTVQGSGPPLVIVPPWTTHLAVQAGLSGHQRFHAALEAEHTVVLYDRWGTGLSDRRRTDFSSAGDVQVLVDLVDHLRLRRFAILGPSHGGPIAAEFTRRFPRRVSHLILYGARASELTGGPTWSALRELMLVNWPVATRSIAAVATKGGDPGDVDAFAALLQAAATPEMTVALQDAAGKDDTYAHLVGLQQPTLVLHRRGDSLVSAEAASRIAGSIPGARLELLAGEAHVHTVGDVDTLVERILAFTGGSGRHPSAQLSSREAEVLGLVVDGCRNAEVAERLMLSVRTVERHLLNAYTKLGVRGRTEAAARWRGKESRRIEPPA
ncbi:MAG: alpha/beta fold hydrolase [Actinomycetota bacterium]|nr:alpha/beta fold hydrolase [Actinomycetota bacterium]